MNELITKRSPQSIARAAGVLYLLNIVTTFLALFFLRGLFVPGDAVITATNLATHQLRFQSGFALELISTTSSIGVASFLYVLLQPVNPGLSLLAAFFRLVACAIFAFSYLFQLVTSNLSGRQLDAVWQVLSGLRAQSSSIGIVFFAFYFLLIGYLIFRSGFLPRFLGILVGLAGFGALIFVDPPLGRSLFLYFAPVGLLAEVSLTTWLLAKGVNVDRWRTSVLLGPQTESGIRV